MAAASEKTKNGVPGLEADNPSVLREFIEAEEVFGREGFEKQLVQARTLLTLGAPEKLPFVKVLQEKKLDSKLWQALNAVPCMGNDLKGYVVKILRLIMPENFIPSLNLKLRAFDSSGTEALQQKGDQSLYHLADDDRMLRVMREGFKNLDEHGLDPRSTGRVEQVLGLNGVFFTYGREYEHGYSKEGTRNLVVFPAEAMHEDDSICIHGELSYGVNFGLDTSFFQELQEYYDFESMFEKRAKVLSKEQLFQLVFLGLVSVLSKVISPQQVISKVEEGDYCEICVDAKKLRQPQMVIAEDEPEFFYEEAQASGSPYAEVPFISDESVRSALKSAGIEIEESAAQRSKFVELVNKGLLNPGDWAVNR